jgi:hypothetical protein
MQAVLKCTDGPTVWEGGANKAADVVPGAAGLSLSHDFAEW